MTMEGSVRNGFRVPQCIVPASFTSIGEARQASLPCTPEEIVVTIGEAFDLVEAGQGRWDVQLQKSFVVAGHIWRTAGGFTLYDWRDRVLGTFRSIDDALRFLLQTENGSLGRSRVA